jgi:hypothetical protein
MPSPKDANPTDLHVGERVRMFRVKARIREAIAMIDQEPSWRGYAAS